MRINFLSSPLKIELEINNSDRTYQEVKLSKIIHQISNADFCVTCHDDQKYVHGIQERYAVAKYTTMDRCFNLEDVPGRERYESAYLS